MDDAVLAPKMPDEFYNSIEGFLCLSPPKIQGFQGIVQKKYEDKILESSANIGVSESVTSIRSKGPLKGHSSDSSRTRVSSNLLPRHSNGVSLSKISAKSSLPDMTMYLPKNDSNTSKPSKGPIDVKLLHDAFNYKIQIHDDNASNASKSMPPSTDSSTEKPFNTHSSSSRPALPVSPSNKKLKKIYCSGLVNRVRAETNPLPMSNSLSKLNEFHVSTAPIPNKKSGLDHSSLIENLQTGSVLQQLLRELAQSEEAYKRTTMRMEDLVRDTVEGNANTSRKR